MKLQVRTLERNTFTVTFSEFETVGEFKSHVCRIRGRWVKPDAQQLLYGGQVLDDYRLLRSYCIDERKFLVMLPRPTKRGQLPRRSKVPSILINSDEEEPENVQEEIAPPPMCPELIKEKIMRLGSWTEKEVCCALQLSLNNQERALKLLKNKISFFTKMVTPPSSEIFLKDSQGTLIERSHPPPPAKDDDHVDEFIYLSDDDESVLADNSSYKSGNSTIKRMGYWKKFRSKGFSDSSSGEEEDKIRKF